MAIAFVANVAKTTNGTSGAIDTTGANLIVVVVGWLASGASSTDMVTVVDSKSNNYFLVGKRVSINGTVGIFVCTDAIVGSGHTFTVTGGLNSYCVAAFSGAYGVRNATNGVQVTSTSVQPGSLTPPIDGCLLVAGLGDRTVNTISVDSGFTITDQNPFASGTAVGAALAYKIQTSAGAEDPTFSWSDSQIACANMAIIEPTPSGGGASEANMGHFG